MKRRAERHPNEPPSAVYLEEVLSLEDTEVNQNLPERQNLLRTIRRRQCRHRPPLPSDLSTLTIPEPYNRTLRNEVFLQYNMGYGTNERILIFYAPRALEYLCRSKYWICDGTFKTVPSQFYQLYAIHGIIHGNMFPLVYALTSRKTQETYQEIFNELKELQWLDGYKSPLNILLPTLS